MNQFLFVILILFGWANLKAQVKPPCGLALTRLAPKSETEINQIQSHFLEKGFKQVGDSNHFLHSNIAAEILFNGDIRFYFEKFYWPTDWTTTTARPIERLTAAQGVIAISPSSHGPKILEAQDADSPVGIQWLKSPYAQRPILEQLTRAGFRPVSDSPGLYKYPSSDPGKNILAFVDEGQLVSLFEEMLGYKARNLPEQFDIVIVNSNTFDNGLMKEPFSEIVLNNGTKRITISSYGRTRGNVVRDDEFTPKTLREGLAEREKPTLNDIPILEIETRLISRQDYWNGPINGTKSLIDVLVKDNSYVLDDLNLTHQQLAEPLKIVHNIWSLQSSIPRGEMTFNLEGNRYKVEGAAFWVARDTSQFGDNTTLPMSRVTVTNLHNNAKISYSGLVPEMIWRYGFYEGQGTPYRVDPKDIVAVFDFLVR